MTKPTLLTRKPVIVIILLVLAAAGAGSYILSDRVESGALTDLDPQSLAQLRNEFNAAAGDVRVIVLLSPT